MAPKFKFQNKLNVWPDLSRNSIVSIELRNDESYKAIPVSSSSESPCWVSQCLETRETVTAHTSMTDSGPVERKQRQTNWKKYLNCYWIFSSFSSLGVFSTTDVKNPTTINFYVKKGPSYLKAGSPYFSGGHVCSLPSHRRSGYPGFFALCHVPFLFVGHSHKPFWHQPDQLLRKEVWMKLLGHPDDLWFICWSD